MANPAKRQHAVAAPALKTEPLPGYVLKRNAQATSAGLAIERQLVKDGRLTTWYGGTEQQWRRSTFCRRRGDRPIGKTLSRDFDCFSPDRGRGYISLRRRGNNDYRGTLVNELLPTWIDDLGDGISVYEMKVHEGVELVYVGPMKALIHRKIAPPEIAERYWIRSKGDCGEVIWTHDTTPDGRCIFRDQISVREQLACAEAESHKTNFKHPSEMLKFWTALTASALLEITTKCKRTETKGGQIFALTKDSLNTIENLTEELLDTIRCAQVTVRDANPSTVEQRQQVGRARSDRSFQRFMGALHPDADASV
jgi:hypothetical protein